MAQIFGDKLLMFHAAEVDSNSVHSHDAGTNIDLAAFPASSITSMSADEDYVYLWFGNATQFEGMHAANDGTTQEIMEQAKVRLTVAEGTEHKVIEDLWSAMTAVSAGPVLKFDAVNSVYPVENVTAIVIYRTTTTYTIESDS